MSVERTVFDGFIMGAGSTSGIRVVVGIWPRSPFGAIADAMVEDAAGHRVLLAPTDEVARFIADTYTFDEIRIEHVRIRRSVGVLGVESPSLRLQASIGGRTPLGQVLSLVPRAVATAPGWAAGIDPIARTVMKGVRTYGTAGNGRTEWYAALDQHRLTAANGFFDGADLGELTPIEPPVRFGFGSVPPQPSLVRVVSTVQLADAN